VLVEKEIFIKSDAKESWVWVVFDLFVAVVEFEFDVFVAAMDDEKVCFLDVDLHKPLGRPFLDAVELELKFIPYDCGAFADHPGS
jgi:hypothetical protein